MPRFTRHKGYYSYEPRSLPRRYVIKKDDAGKWSAEAYKVVDGVPGSLRMKHSDIPQKRDAVALVSFWMDQGL